MVTTPVYLRSLAETGGRPVPTDITPPGEDPVFASRDLVISGQPGHAAHDSPAVQEGLLTSLQLLQHNARLLPPPLVELPDIVGYLTTPEIPGFTARTYAVCKNGEQFELFFMYLGPLLSQSDMENRVWEQAANESRLLKMWMWTFGRFWFRGYYDLPGFAQEVEEQLEVAKIRHDCNRLRREMGRPVVDDGEGYIDPSLLSPSAARSLAWLKRRQERLQAEREVDPRLLEPVVQLVEL